MNEIQGKLEEHFHRSSAPPFLFIGSGFSRRYIGLEDWSSLLKRFCAGIQHFEYYLASADGNLPRTASLMSKDFHQHWWNAEEYEEHRSKFRSKLRDKSSALRIEICEYLSKLALDEPTDELLRREAAVLSSLNVDGIITTNWDGYIEKLFPDYRVFIGQDELIFSNPQSIAEIYKIHGCCTRPHSLVLTEEDYRGFNGKNPYLAAKLITLFVEHPIVLIGYSLSDENIVGLLRSITQCLGDEKLDQLQNNLVFVQRANQEVESYAQTLMSIEGIQLPITVVKLDTFLPLYAALDSTKRRIPARILRYCKEQLYELVKAEDSGGKLAVVDIDHIENKDDIEFVVGIGVTDVVADVGYHAITSLDLFRDLLQDESAYDARSILTSTIPQIGKSSTYIPVYRYLREVGVDSTEKLNEAGYNVDRHLQPDWKKYASTNYRSAFENSQKSKSCQEIVDGNTPEKAAIFLSFVGSETFDRSVVKEFLLSNTFNFDNSVSNYSTYFRKLACRYDYEQYGW